VLVDVTGIYRWTVVSFE